MLKQIIKQKIILLLLPIFIYGETDIKAQALKGRLFYSFGSKKNQPSIAKQVVVMIAPRNKQNEKILDNSNFIIGKDAELVKTINAFLTTTDDNGYYFFNKIPKGRFIFKVCIAYGTSFKFKISDDNYNIKLFEDMLASYNN